MTASSTGIRAIRIARTRSNGPDQIEWIKGAKQAVALLKAQGYRVFVVTNQFGIVRGYFDMTGIEALHRWMNTQMQAHGGVIDDFRIAETMLVRMSS